MVKDTDEQSDEDIHRVRPRRVPSRGASVPMELGCTTLLACRYVQKLRNFLNLVLLGLLWRFHHEGMMDHELNL